MGSVSTADLLRCTWLRKTKHRCLILGQDAVGKTSLLYTLKLGQQVNLIPTIGFNVEVIDFHQFKVEMWDIGGGCKIKQLWPHYFENTSLIIYIVDSSQRGRIQTDQIYLSKTMNHPLLKHAALVVIMSKIDKQVIGKQEMRQLLGFDGLPTKQKRIVEIQTNSVLGVQKLREQLSDLFERE